MSIVFGTPTTGKLVLGVEPRRDAERVLAADRDERVQPLRAEGREHALDAALDLVRVRARRAEDRPAARQDPGDVARAERLERPVDEPAPALAHADRVPVRGRRAAATTARITAFRPGQSPPPVRIPAVATSPSLASSPEPRGHRCPYYAGAVAAPRRESDNGDDLREEGSRPWRVEGSRDDTPKREPRPWQRRLKRLVGGRRGWLLVLALAMLNWYLAAQVGQPEPRTGVPYSVFRQQVTAGNVSDVATRADALEGTFKRALPGQTIRQFTTARPSIADDGLMPLLLSKHVAIDAKPPPGRPLFTTLFVGLGPTILIVGVMIWFFRRMTRGGFSGLGRSKAKRYEPTTQRTTFADVAGIEEAAARGRPRSSTSSASPEKYRRLGGAMPRGVLLSGPPGTGKTLLARAMAGEAGVPFFSLSASEFVEMVVGVGASRVRDLFEQAKNEAPAIIFIDELDAIGRARGSGGGMGGAGSDEREQTLNQILTEMDGFSGSEGVIVIAATNRPEILDSALAPPRPVRPARRRQPARPARPQGDPRGPHPRRAARRRRRPADDRVDDARDGRRRPPQPDQRGRAPAARRNREEVTAQDFTDAFEQGAPRRRAEADAHRGGQAERPPTTRQGTR